MASRILRVYHEGRHAAHRERDHALVAAGAEVLLVVPERWPGAQDVRDDALEIVQLPVTRPGDVNRHRYVEPVAISELVAAFRPDVVDLHEEPFSAVVHQLLRVLPREQAVVSYAAQNVDKRFPPPFAQYENAALRRLDGIYPCSMQAASVVVGKGFRGAMLVVPLAPAAAFRGGTQRPPVDTLNLLLVGRLVPEKGVLDAVHVLADAGAGASLTLVGDGPELETARRHADELGVGGALNVKTWRNAEAVAADFREAQVVLVPSTATRTWVEQFGRVVVEAQASGAVVVAYGSGALPEVIGDAGVVVTPGDNAALGRAVRSLRDEPRRWLELRERSLAAAPTWDGIARGQLELYAGAVRAARTRAAVRRPAPTRPDRARAVTRFGPTASLGEVTRPFALPVLRDDNAVTRALATVADAAGRLISPPTASGRLRVVFVDHVARLSGGEIALARLVAASTDVDAHVILGEDGPLRAELERHGASVEVLELGAGARDTRRDAAVGAGGARAAGTTAAYTLRLARRLRQLRPDLVHTNSLKSGYYGCAAARLAGVPAVWHLRDRLADDYLPPRAVAVTRAVVRRLPDAVLCPSREVAALVGAPTAVVPDPYATTRPPRAPSDAVRTVGVVGRLVPWKGQHVVLRALAQLPDVRVRIVGAPMFGEDDYLDQLRQLACELRITERVDFVGFVNDVAAELAGLDVLVHASTVPEPFGQVIVEALAAGVPVIAADAGGPREIITDGVDGLLVRPGDADALAAMLRRLAADAGLRARLQANGVRRAADFDPASVAAQVRAIYDVLVRVR